MVRYVWIAAMLAILCIVLYIPSAVPARALHRGPARRARDQRDACGARPRPTASSGACSTCSRARRP